MLHPYFSSRRNKLSCMIQGFFFGKGVILYLEKISKIITFFNFTEKNTMFQIA